MAHYVSFPDEVPEGPIENLVINLVDPATDAGAVSRLIAHSLAPLDGQPAALFDTDPLMDYRAQRPWVNFEDGKLVGLWRDGLVLSNARDMEGQPFLHLHGMEPDFHWEALVSDMLDIVERFGVRHIFAFTAIGSATPHTRPADMVVRSSDPDTNPEVLEANFWFQSSFADYLEFQTSRLDLGMTNVAVRVPMYLVGHHFSAGAAGVLKMVSSLSGLRLPVGDLEQDSAGQVEELAELMEQNEELKGMIAALENDYDQEGATQGFVTAPEMELAVPSVDEIGRAAEQFLAQADVTLPNPAETDQYDPQGLIQRIAEFRQRNRVMEQNDDGRPRSRFETNVRFGDVVNGGVREAFEESNNGKSKRVEGEGSQRSDGSSEPEHIDTPPNSPDTAQTQQDDQIDGAGAADPEPEQEPSASDNADSIRPSNDKEFRLWPRRRGRHARPKDEDR